jgi:branched-chain amino acid transport system ATP-binding protein
VLTVERVTAGYGGRPVLHDLSLTVGAAEIVALVGANGAGKSTTLKAIMGVVRPQHGRIDFGGQALAGASTAEVVGRGVVLVPEGRHVFPRLTVAENLRIGAFSRADRASYGDDLPRVYELFPVLASRSRQEAGTLSGGEQQMLAIGRALMARPRCLLLDEPSLGLAPLMIHAVFEAIRKINVTGMAILLVEQKAFVALNLATRSYVLENGRVVAEGDSQALAADPRVKRAYLR